MTSDRVCILCMRCRYALRRAAVGVVLEGHATVLQDSVDMYTRLLGEMGACGGGNKPLCLDDVVHDALFLAVCDVCSLGWRAHAWCGAYRDVVHDGLCLVCGVVLCGARLPSRHPDPAGVVSAGA